MVTIYVLCVIIAILNLVDAYQTTKYVGKKVKLKNSKIAKTEDINPIVNLLLKKSHRTFWCLKIVASLLIFAIPLVLPVDIAEFALLPSLLFLTFMFLIAVTSSFIHSSRIEKIMEKEKL
jgi:hypothetical protein